MQNIGEAVLCVIGKAPETANRYAHTRVLATFPNTLPATEIEALLTYLAEPTENVSAPFPNPRPCLSSLLRLYSLA